MSEPANKSVLTRDGWAEDAWHVLRNLAEPDPSSLGEAQPARNELILLPLASYLAQPQPATRGVWLSPADDPKALIPHLQNLSLIAIDFPVFTDGRGYSIASTLRNRCRYGGDLRAIGDVLIDQLFYLRRVGFSSFALRADQDRERAVTALRTFSEVYQGAADQPWPAFRRHARPDAQAASR